MYLLTQTLNFLLTRHFQGGIFDIGKSGDGNMYEIKKLAHNIRKQRLSKGYTQTSLAKEMNITPQNISKWENALSMPDVRSLCKLCLILGTSPDTLLGNTRHEDRGNVMIGIDGGGTKTEFVLFSDKGEIFARCVLSGSNLNYCGVDKALSVLKKGIDKMLSFEINVSGIYAGIAGCGSKGNARDVLDFLTKTYPGIDAVADSDITNMVNTSPEYSKYIGVIAGTGSVVYAKVKDKIHRFGGWGCLFDPGGSGYDFGRDAICASLAQRDGFGEKTLICDLVEKKLQGPARENMNLLYSSEKNFIASFSQCVFDAYKMGDALAKTIIEKNAGRIAYLIQSMSAKYDCSNRVVMAGGLMKQKDIITEFLSRITDGKYTFEINDLPQIYGACLSGCKIFATPSENFREIFKQNYLNISNEELFV